MVVFAEQEKLVITELTPIVRTNLASLPKLTTRFEEAQQVLERDEFETESHFIGSLLSIEYHVHKFAETQGAAVKEIDRYLENIKR
jgi:hypothetical protein